MTSTEHTITVPAALWDNMREQTMLSSTVIVTVLDILTTQPLIASQVGPDFIREASDISTRLKGLLTDAATMTAGG